VKLPKQKPLTHSERKTLNSVNDGNVSPLAIVEHRWPRSSQIEKNVSTVIKELRKLERLGYLRSTYAKSVCVRKNEKPICVVVWLPVTKGRGA
jgi:hypothetical protein